jgi:3-methylcrotonyl-CoA carboxylase alpha subunit
MTYVRKILVANRGEIAARIFRSCRALGIGTVAVYSEADRGALHVRAADEAYLIGPAPAAASYLSIERILAAARQAGADAIHPGYGFLSERAAFAEAVAAAGLLFIGPSPDAIARMGDKVAARGLAQEANVPVVPGYDGADQSAARLASEAARVGFPLLVKASAGGGGRGMRVVQAPAELPAALESARREAGAAFGDERVFLERLIAGPRHVEIQVFADRQGGVIHLGERECSIQRRHQKIVEEAPSPALAPALRAEMGAAAVRVARAVDYLGAGTVEFILGEDGSFYFLEMNTRLQVEHPVTEALTGLDLVAMQIAVATGESLPLRQEDVQARGHAIEVRLYAEDPQRYLPSAGQILALDFPPADAPSLRIDAGYAAGDTVGTHYDPLLAKIVVHGADRATAILRLREALAATSLTGVTTNLPLLRAIAASAGFAAADTTTDFLERHALDLEPEPPIEALAAAAAFDLGRGGLLGGALPASPWQAGPWRLGRADLPLRYQSGGRELVVLASHEGGAHWRFACGEQALTAALDPPDDGGITLEFDGQTRSVAVRALPGALLVPWQGQFYRLARARAPEARAHMGLGAEASDHDLRAPMPGTVRRLLVAEGQEVALNQALLVLEAMKMEHTIASPYDGRVTRLLVAEGELVSAGAPLIEIAEVATPDATE